MGDNIISVKAVSEGTPLTKVRAKNFEFVIDEPEFFGGQNQAPSPVDYLLGSVAGCISAIGAYMAKEMGFEIRRLEVSVDGTIDADRFFGLSDKVRAGFREIVITIDLDSTADEDQIGEWNRQLALRCPVLDNLLHPVRIVLKNQGPA